MKNKIIDIDAREVLDSRGIPTVEATITLTRGIKGVATVPSGASTGAFEAVELRDGDKKRFLGKGVLQAVENIKTIIKNALLGADASQQAKIDKKLIKLDGSENKSTLGANALLAVSLATAKAAANAKGVPLYRYLGEATTLPVPMCNILNGGAHASNNIDIQEFMIMPVGAKTFAEGIRWCSEIFHTLKQTLVENGHSTAVGDEGGFAPNLEGAEIALDFIIQAVKKAGYRAGKDIQIALDAAASEWWVSENNYILPKSGKKYTTSELVEYWCELVKKYPIASLEDPLAEEDWEGWIDLTRRLGRKVQIVGDDLYVTNPLRLNKGIDNKSSNSILIKPNQIGTLSETLETIKLAQAAKFTTVISHRSGETEDTTIADLAVAVGATQIKAGSVSRSERTAKYNRLIQIEEELGDAANYCGKKAFPKLK